MKFKILGASIVVAGLLLSGCASSGEPQATATPVAKVLSEPTPHVKGLMD